MTPYRKSTLLVIDQANPNQFEAISSDSFISLNIWERTHIQEWIRSEPKILGEDLFILTVEFNKYVQSSDRLDILALDKKGNLVVIELKRDDFAAYADLQAIRYAAMVSSMTLENLSHYVVEYRRKYCHEHEYSTDKAFEELKEFVEVDDFKELSNRPRIILCSENFSTELTTTVLWLNQCGLDISCVRIRPHRVGDKIVVVPTVIIPVPEAKQYQTEIQKKEEAKQDATSRSKRPTTIKILLDNGKIKMGDLLTLRDNLPTYVQQQLNDYSADFFTAEITGKLGQQNNVRWREDGKEYSISNLTRTIFSKLHSEKEYPSALTGGLYWRHSNGKNLYDWADEVWNEQNQS